MILYQIARNTARESLREPIYYLLLLSALFCIGFSPLMALFVFRDQYKLVCDTALATTLVFGLICCVLCAGHTVSREMSNGTVLLLLSKPVSRWSFVLAKIAGIMFAMTIFVVACEAAALVSLSVAKDQFNLDWKIFYAYFGILGISSLYGAVRNYLHGKPFASSGSIGLFALFLSLAIIVCVNSDAHAVGEDAAIGFSLLLPAFAMILFAVWIMVALTVSFSTRLETVANLVLISAVFFMGLVSDYFFGASAGSFSIGGILYAILPNWQLFWLADAITARKVIPLSYVMLGGLYSAVYIAFVAFLAILFFHGREAGSDAK